MLILIVEAFVPRNIVVDDDDFIFIRMRFVVI